MSDDRDFCMAQAETCARAARETDLPRQREKFEQARDRWLTLANRAASIVAAKNRRAAGVG